MTDGSRVPQRLPLRLLPAEYAICRLPAASPPPAWAAGELVLHARTPASTTVIAEQARVPHGVDAQRGWRAFEVGGPLPFDAVGVLAALAGPLAAAGIPIFAVGVWETDYVLVPGTKLEAARAALRAAGHDVRD